MTVTIYCVGRDHRRLDWAIGTFGKEAVSPTGGPEKLAMLRDIPGGWFYSQPNYYFANEEDAMLFLLRWNGEVVESK